jgi:1,2-diacylglycerol 3-alpha-glucosyltransferase
MRIAHICLSNWYIPNVGYQENEIVREHLTSGHDVLVIASTEVHAPDGGATYSAVEDTREPGGARVVRLSYRFWPHKLARKLRVHSGVYKLLKDFKPDAILFHGASGWEVGTVARYAQDHPNVVFYIDSHEDLNNSGRTLLSYYVLHRLYYRFCLSRAWKTARKILCISTETMDFVHIVYGVPLDKLEFFPLGGQLVGQPEYDVRRQEKREKLGLSASQILFVQSGKQTKRKKLLESLRAFRDNAPVNARLAVAGSLSEDIRQEAQQMMAEMPNVMFLGWQNTEDLTDLLCAADIYLQPGTQSVTMQHSLCCHCAVIIDNVKSHEVYKANNGWFIENEEMLGSAIAATATADLRKIGENSYTFARKMLDYKSLSRRVLTA